MTQTFKGRTEDAEAPFLSADFWEEGKEVCGKIIRSFDTQIDGKVSPAFVLELRENVEIDGEEQEHVSVGANMAGFKMALQAAGLSALRVGDILTLRCTGKKPPKKEGHSPRTNFEIEIVRN